MVYIFMATLAALVFTLLLGLVISTIRRLRDCRLPDDIILNDALSERFGGRI